MNFNTDHLTRKVPAMFKKSAHRLTATVRRYFRGGTGVDNPFARWRFLRPVSAVVLTAFTMLSTAPAVAAFNATEHLSKRCCGASNDEKKSTQPLPDKLQSSLIAISEALDNVNIGVAAKKEYATASGVVGKDSIVRPEVAALIRLLKEKIPKIKEDGKVALVELRDSGDALKKLALSTEKIKVQEETVAAFERRLEKVISLSEQVVLSDSQSIESNIKSLSSYLAQISDQRQSRPFDPNDLAFRQAKAEVREPIVGDDGRHNYLFGNQRKTATSPIKLFDVRTGSSAKTDSADDDLAETEEIQITEAIKAKARELGNSPLHIYRWVHDNIEYAPTYGVLQSSGYTLKQKQGNAYDISSLLIALLRASGIKSRYNYGVINISESAAMNWLGEVSTLNDAQLLLAQGGVPVKIVRQGGKPAGLQIEHIWVEALINYYPSRGVKLAPEGQGKVWVPLDASFKEYTFSQPVLTGEKPRIVEDELVASLKEDTQISGDAVIGFYEEGFYDYLRQYQQKALTYYQGASSSGFSAEAVFGRRSVKPFSLDILPGSLPYEVQGGANKFASLPENLKHKIAINIYPNQLARDLQAPTFSGVLSVAGLAGRKIGIHFAPSSQSDKALIDSAIAAGAKSLPAYLISVFPEILVDGRVIGSGASSSMGQSIVLGIEAQAPNVSTPYLKDFDIVAGDEVVLGINGGGVSPDVVADRLAQAWVDTASENLFQVALHYWMQSDLLNKMAAKAFKVHVQRLPSIGLFSAPLTVTSSFGIARSAHYQSRIMDVSRAVMAVVGADAATRKKYLLTSGMQSSYLEGYTFERLFNKTPGSGVSTVQVLKDAAGQLIPIYVLNAANYERVLPNISIDSRSLENIRNAISIGKEVVVPQRAPVHDGWSGGGYMIIDPNDGSGSYLISGGLNGGAQTECERQAVAIVDAVKAIIITALLIAMLALLWELVPLLVGAGAGLAGVAAQVLGPTAARVILAFGLTFGMEQAIAAPSNKAACQKAIKLLTQYERLAKKYGINLSEEKLAELDALRNAGVITSLHLPGTLQREFPGQFVGQPLAAIRAECC